MGFKKFDDFIDGDTFKVFSYSEDGSINEATMDFPIDDNTLKDKVAIYTSTYNVSENTQGRDKYITYKKMLGDLITSLKK